MNRLFAFLVTVTFSFASLSHAGVMITSSAPVDLGNGLVGVTVSAVGTNGETVQSLVNLSFQGVHQVWENSSAGAESARRSATQDEQGGTFWNGAVFNQYDSVFLFDKVDGVANSLIALAPGTTFAETNEENNPRGLDLPGPSTPADFTAFSGTAGMGSLSMNGQLTYLQAGGFPSVDIAYLVLPSGGEASYSAQFFVNGASVPGDVISGVITAGGGDPGDPIFESTPGSGSTLDFGYGASTRTLNLAVRNVGDPDTVVNVASFELRNNDLGLYSLPGFTALALEQGAGDSNIVVQFDGSIGTPGIYTADLDLLDGDGNVLATYALTAQVPEPSTVALAGLGLLGLVGFARRRG